MYKAFFKRKIDFIGSLMGLLLLIPVLILLTLALFFANQGKPFFVQVRPGKKEQLFKILKFKTMNDKKDEKGNLLSDAQRLTKMGNFIRKTSLDEIPQLFNVLRGDMSLIGPRPLLPQYLTLYTSIQNRRHEVKPGITGWAQIKGRNTISWQQKFEYDVWYVDNISFELDCKILFWTLKKVIKSEGINAVDSATIKSFNEN